jgi:hypothetical protein
MKAVSEEFTINSLAQLSMLHTAAANLDVADIEFCAAVYADTLIVWAQSCSVGFIWITA